jgi:hypothetical protein
VIGTITPPAREATTSRSGDGPGRAGRGRAFSFGAILLALAAIYTLAGAFGLPLLMRRAFAAWQAQVPGMQLSLDHLSFNPWTLTLGARQLAVRYQGRTLRELTGLRVRARGAALWGCCCARRRWTLLDLS